MTMDLGDLLAKDAVNPALKAEDKRQLLQTLAAQAARLTGLVEHDVFNALLQRERLGSTGLGSGIAIPHVRLSGLDNMRCIFARLAKPVHFDSIDDQPVDLVFLLLAPDHAGGDHLKALARVSRLVRDQGAVERLRSAPDHGALVRELTSPVTSHAA